MTRHTLLLVDNDTQHSRVIEVSLRKSGYEVVSARDGADALAKIESARPSMIISEVDMPNMSGLALCAQLKASHHAKIPFVFLTADNRIDTKVKGLEAGADDYLIRPIYTRELAARVSLIIERQSREQMNRSQTNQQYFGDLEKMSVIDLVQAMSDGQKTGTIRIESRTHKGTLWFREGVLLDASCANSSGADALYRLMTWDKGRFEIDFSTPMRPAAIPESNKLLLFEGLKHLEAWSDIAQQLPPLDAVLNVEYRELAERNEALTDGQTDLIRLFDGERSCRQAIYNSTAPDLKALEMVSQLYFEGLIAVAEPTDLKASAEAIQVYETSAPPAMRPSVADALLQSVEDFTSQPDAIAPSQQTSSSHSPEPAAAEEAGNAERFERLKQRQAFIKTETDAPAVLPTTTQEAEADLLTASDASTDSTPSKPASQFPDATLSDGPESRSSEQAEPESHSSEGRTTEGADQSIDADLGELLTTATHAATETVEPTTPLKQTSASDVQLGLAPDSEADLFPEFEGGATLSEDDEEGFFTSDLGFVDVGPDGEDAEQPADPFTTDDEPAPGVPKLAIAFLVIILGGGAAFFTLKDTIEPLTIPKNALDVDWVKTELKKAGVAGPVEPIEANWRIPSEPEGLIPAQKPATKDAGVAQDDVTEKKEVAEANDATAKTPEMPKKEIKQPNTKPEATPENVIEPDEKKRSKANALTIAAVKLHKKRNYAKAAKTFESALALSPNSGPTLIGYTKTLLELDQISRARVYAEKASRLTPNNAEVFLILGNARQDLGMKNKAIEAYERYLKLAPNGKFASELRQVIKGMKAAPN